MGYADGIWSGFGMFIGMGFLLGIVMIIIIMFGTIGYDKTQTECISSTPIISLQDNKGIEGKYSGGFIYGTGYVKNTLTYYVGVNYPMGFKIEEYDISKCYIVFSNQENPRIETYQYLNTENEQRNWGSPKLSGFFAYYKIYLPENALQVNMQYKIDLK